MKRFQFYLTAMLLLLTAAACSDEFDDPVMVAPTAEATPNMTIAEFKAKYWQDATNYIDTVREDIVIHGYVTSSDESGNIYKCLYIQDETAGLAISINGTSLYNTYRVGQEIVIPLKGLYVGKYNGQQQLGYPQYYVSGQAWEATFMPLAMWQDVAQLNGLPAPAKVMPVDVHISDFQGKTDAATLQKYQGQLVRLKNVQWRDADSTLTYSENDASTNRILIDGNGDTLLVRNSNYADFRAETLPLGRGEVVGLLGSYGTTWQLYLRSEDDVMNFSTDYKPSFNYSETFTAGQGQCTIYDEDISSMPDGSYVWAQNSTYGMKASAYVNSTNYAVVSWLLTPVLDLAETTEPYITFNHTGKYFGNMANEITLWIREGGSGPWTQLPINTYPTGNDWTYVDNTTDLTAWAGKQVQIGFKYASSAEHAPTWEIKSLSVRDAAD